MISSRINGIELNQNGNILNISDQDGNYLDSVLEFDESLDKYCLDLLDVQNEWKKTTIHKRMKIISSIKKNLENAEISKRLIEAICKEVGKPRIEAETEISESIALIDYFLDNVNDDIFITKVNVDPFYDTKKNYIKLYPIGIVGIIKPWNYPITNSLWSIIPAIIAGNVVIYKPSEYCCYTANLLADIIINSELPNGVFNIVFGDFKAGNRITECRKISMISFTGSSTTVNKIQKRSAELEIIRKFSFESGGSDFAIVDENVNLNFAIEGIIWGAFNNAGQVCTSIENIIVPTEIYQEFIQAFQHKVRTLKPGRDYGKIQNDNLKKKVSHLLFKMKESNSSKIISGGIIKNGYLLPTLVECNDFNDINIEIFANIVRIFKYSNYNELCEVVNSSRYGLGCTIWTSEPNSARIKKMIDEINVGMIWINDVNIAYPEMPWTGIKDSGVGFNLSLESIKEFSSVKCVSVDTNYELKKDWWYSYED